MKYFIMREHVFRIGDDYWATFRGWFSSLPAHPYPPRLAREPDFTHDITPLLGYLRQDDQPHARAIINKPLPLPQAVRSDVSSAPVATPGYLRPASSIVVNANTLILSPKRTYQDEEPSAGLPKWLRTFDTAYNAYSSPVHEHYTAAWIRALPLELAASRAMLDERHTLPPNQAGEDNAYLLERIGGGYPSQADLYLGDVAVGMGAKVA